MITAKIEKPYLHTLKIRCRQREPSNLEPSHFTLDSARNKPNSKPRRHLLYAWPVINTCSNN